MMDPHGLTFTVVIPTFERNDLLARCLECLAPGEQIDGTVVIPGVELSSAASKLSPDPSEESARSRFHYEVIVCDDGRTTTSKAMILERFPWARWVAGPGTGPAGNRNAGAAVACGEWLAFTDDDCLPQAGWLRAYRKAIAENRGHDVFEGDILPDRPRQTLAEHAPVGGGAGNLWSCNFAIRSSSFFDLGGFDSQFRVCMEDSDFALRVRNSGRTFPFLKDAVVIHPWRPRKLTQDGWKSTEAEIADNLLFRRKHAGKSSISTTRVLRLALRILWRDICFVLKQGDWKGIPYAAAGFCHTANVALQYSSPLRPK